MDLLPYKTGYLLPFDDVFIIIITIVVVVVVVTLSWHSEKNIRCSAWKENNDFRLFAIAIIRQCKIKFWRARAC
jgi:hypothetical protein